MWRAITLAPAQVLQIAYILFMPFTFYMEEWADISFVCVTCNDNLRAVAEEYGANSRASAC
jgi:hypothetical protein